MRRRLLGCLVTLAMLLSASACTQVRNPATGELQYTSLSPEEEARLGRAEHPRALAQFGGTYGDAQLQAYVERVGTRVKNASEMAGEDFTFTLLDSDMVNAFALPGGYVYVTRGLLALANDEAELAGVLGHEVGHITARHTAQRYDRAQAGQLGTVAAQVLGALGGAYLGGAEGARLGGQFGGQLGSLGAAAYVQGFSREQEFEADQLGIRYLAGAGYDPTAMATFLEALQANDAFEARRAGRSQEDENLFSGWLRSHPRTPDRVARAAENEASATPGARDTERAAFLAAIDGMIYGENPAQGFVRGNRFEHPVLRIAFDAPPGFRLQNSPSAVLGTDGRGRFLLFDMAPEGTGGGDLRGYLQNEWVTNQRLQDLRSLTVNGLDAAVGFGRVALNDQPAQAMFSAVRAADGKVYRLLYARAGNLTRTDVAAFEESLRSFRGLTASEAAALRPMRIEVVTVGPGDTVQSLAGRMEVDENAQALFELLNGLDRGRRLEPGAQVKLIRRG